MRKQEQGSRPRAGGRERGVMRRPIVWALALGAAAVVAGGVWPQSLPADAETQKAEELQALCETDQAYHRRARALQDLITLDTSAAHKSLEALAASKDELLAVQAMSAIGRADYSGAKSFLKKCFGDTKRSDHTRTAALASYCAAEHRSGASWSEIKDNCKGASSTDTVLDSARDALKSKLWGEK